MLSLWSCTIWHRPVHSCALPVPSWPLECCPCDHAQSDTDQCILVHYLCHRGHLNAVLVIMHNLTPANTQITFTTISSLTLFISHCTVFHVIQWVRVTFKCCCPTCITSSQPQSSLWPSITPSTLKSRLKLICFTNHFFHTLSGSIWTAFTIHVLGPDTTRYDKRV